MDEKKRVFLPLEEAKLSEKKWDEIEARLMKSAMGFKPYNDTMQEKPILPMSDEAGPTPNKEVSEYLKGLKEIKPGALHVEGPIEPIELHVDDKLVNESYSFKKTLEKVIEDSDKEIEKDNKTLRELAEESEHYSGNLTQEMLDGFLMKLFKSYIEDGE